MWELYVDVSTQWRYAGMAGIRTGLDTATALELMKARGWDLRLGLNLLGALEREYLEWDRNERSKQDRP